jgi:sulfotransferase
MDRKYNFISGLPRSGSTLLSSILKQNPRFTAAISDPLLDFCHSIIRDVGNSVGMEAAVPVEKRKELIRGLFDSFYSDSNEVCFNTNRAWTANTSLLKDLFPNFKMIVCVRHIPWILDSFEQLNNKNPYTIKALYHHQDLQTSYQRANMLMGVIPNFLGYVAGPLECLKHSLSCGENQQICYVEYGTLTSNPLETMKKIYDFLEEPWFEHDFDNVEDSYDEFDSQAKIEGLHNIRKKVQFIPRNTILPSDLWAQYEQHSFWLHEDFKKIKKTINWIEIVNNTPINSPFKKQL